MPHLLDTPWEVEFSLTAMPMAQQSVTAIAVVEHSLLSDALSLLRKRVKLLSPSSTKPDPCSWNPWLFFFFPLIADYAKLTPQGEEPQAQQAPSPRAQMEASHRSRVKCKPRWNKM
jgi:hypothetical protein